MKFTFAHNNLNVRNLQESVSFYERALGFRVVREAKAPDGSFRIAWMEDGETSHQLELTWLQDHPQAYDLGENEFHLAVYAEDYEKAHALHSELGIICYENPAMGIYFIHDPDDYWTEILPPRQ